MDNTCTVCMECVSEKNQSRRPCGHMMCVSCDSVWRSRGKIEEIKMQRKDNKSKEKISIFMTVSNCPSCRRKDTPHDYHGRSKVSMFHEIQFLTRTLYMSGINVSMMYTPAINEMNEVTVTTPPPVVRRPDIFTPPPVPVLRRANAFSPYIPAVTVINPPVVAHTPIESAFASLPSSAHVSGTCCRRVQRLGCYTTRTKLKCGDCNRFLCRSCRGTGCVCRTP
jgi:hypothetical protein